MICPKCGADNPATNRFCDSCGQKMADKEKKKAAVPSQPAPVAAPVSSGSPATGWFQGIDPEHLLWAVIVVVGGFLLFYQLGMKPLHHDESLHAYYSWELFKGMGYAYNPMMHGPFLFHFNALVYFLIGASDYTCRVLPALLGLLTLGMTYFLRPYLGRSGALFAGAMLALSPSFTYFGRFIRNDIFITGFTMVMVFGLFRYLDTRRPRYLYWAAVALGLSFATKEVTYITGAIFATFFFFRWLWEYTARLPGESKLLEALQGLWQERKPLWIGLACFFGVVVILYTTVFTHPMGLIDAFTKSLTYWLGQHEVQRGSQPVYFYLGLIPLYETLAFLGGVAAAVYYGFVARQAQRAWRLLGYVVLGAAWWLFTTQGTETFGLIFSLLLVALGSGLLAYFSFGTSRDLFVTFLIVWMLGAFSDYSFAGERMPWLILHPLLPMILLTGYFIGDLWERFRARRGWILAAVIPFLALMLHNTALVNFYGGGANPSELLVYVQTSTDIPQVVRQLKNMSDRLTGGREMKITCEDYCSWPFAWYLRDFKNVGYPKFTSTQAEGTIEKNPIIISGIEMAAPGHDDRVAELLAEDYVAQRYKLRVWWAPDSQMFFSDTLAGKAHKVWRLIMYREPWSGLGSYDMIVYVRKDVAHLYWSHAQEPGR